MKPTELLCKLYKHESCQEINATLCEDCETAYFVSTCNSCVRCSFMVHDHEHLHIGYCDDCQEYNESPPADSYNSYDMIYNEDGDLE